MLYGSVGTETFGFDRYINQIFYHSKEWKKFRREIIIRDDGCDLGVEGHEIERGIIIHHMNPISTDDIINKTEYLLNPEYVICTMLSTHNAIHYADEQVLQDELVIRKPNDTCPWKKGKR